MLLFDSNRFCSVIFACSEFYLELFITFVVVSKMFILLLSESCRRLRILAKSRTVLSSNGKDQMHASLGDRSSVASETW